MNTKNPYLFIYGTLLLKQNLFAAYLQENSSFYAKAKLKGLLYDIGSYPGVLYLPESDKFIYGNIVRLANPVKALEKLDYYEGIGEAFAQPQEYVRELVEVETDDAKIECWVYLYNWPVDGLPVISSGDYLRR